MINCARLATLPKREVLTEPLFVIANQYANITTLADFSRFIFHLAQKATLLEFDRSLDVYLRALWGLVQQNSRRTPSFGLMAQMLDDALCTEPVPFRKAWLLFRRPPDWFSPASIEDDFGNLCGMLLYQIADLHRMSEAGILDLPAEELAYGVTTPSGNRWHNFSLADFLQSGYRSLKVKSSVSDCDWDFLAMFLWLGQNF